MEIHFNIGKGHLFSVAKWILWPLGLVIWLVDHAKRHPDIYEEILIMTGLIGGAIAGFIFGIATIIVSIEEPGFAWKCFLTFWGCAAYFFGSLKWAVDNN